MDFRKNPKTEFKPIEQIGKEEAAKECAALREGIHYHDHLYFVKNRPEISDAVYDRLFRRLQALEQAHPEFRSPDSPTLRVGAEPVSRLKKVRHAAPMLSLEGTLEETAVRAFCQMTRRHAGASEILYALEPKFDGFSVEVVYERGGFRAGSTRGNGEAGEDISHNLKTIGSVPLTLMNTEQAPRFLAVRGEVFLSKKGFLALNKKRIERGEDPFANPRNAAAGMMRQLDSRKVAGMPLDVYFYEILALEREEPAPSTHRAAIRQFVRWGLKVSPLNRTVSSYEEIHEYHRSLAERRDRLDYDIDGIVIKMDDYALRERMGMRERNPRWAIAWKFPPREEITLLEDIMISVGRTGMLTPSALLRPVDVGGVTVSRATLHNEDEVRRKDVRAGDWVRIIRAGDVIPEVKERVEQPGERRGAPFSMPERCPACGSAVVREGAYSLCTAGLSCPAQLASRIRHFASRNAMNIEHLGEKTAEQLVERGMARDLADLFYLSVEELKALEGFAEKSARLLHDAVHSAKHPRLDRFLYALGIRHVGSRIARLAANDLITLEAVVAADKERLRKIPDIGVEIADSIVHFFRQKENREVLRKMAKAGIEVLAMPTRPQALPLKDKTFVLTGALETLTRQAAKERIEALGGRVASSVSRETDYLVVGKNPGSKIEEAGRLRIETLDEAAFRKMIGEA